MHLHTVLSIRSRCWQQPGVRALSATMVVVKKRARESVRDR
jgi:hypothetical protein